MLLTVETKYAEGKGSPVVVMYRHLEKTLAELRKAGITVFSSCFYEGHNAGFIYVKPEEKQLVKSFISLVEYLAYQEKQIRELYKEIHTR